MNKILIVFLVIFGILIPEFNCHFDRKKHYRLSLKETQRFNIHDSIKSFSEDQEHLEDDLSELYNFKVDTKDMTEGERNYFFFVLHDMDRNKKLDGLEILLSMNHQFDDPLDEEELNGHVTTQRPQYNPENPHSYYENLKLQKSWNERYEADAKFVDSFLDQYDKDKDGYLSYGEFMVARNDDEH